MSGDEEEMTIDKYRNPYADAVAKSVSDQMDPQRRLMAALAWAERLGADDAAQFLQKGVQPNETATPTQDHPKSSAN